MTAPSLKVPTLIAGPLRLRPFAQKDREMVCEAASDPYIPLITTVPAPCSEDEALAFIERQDERARQGIGYPFAIAEAATDAAIGFVGLWLRDAERGRAALGYWIVASARGRGTATRALSTVSRWALTELRIPRLELYVEPWNAASIRTAERAGFKREGLMRSWQQIGAQRRDMYMYSLLQADHKAPV